jgi:hypothetical protein
MYKYFSAFIQGAGGRLMDDRIQTLLDHHEIQQLLATYCHGCDRGDEVEMASVYSEDSFDDHGPRKMSGRELAIDTVGDTSASIVSHQLGQSLIRVQGDAAGAETYFLATVIYPPDAEGRQDINQLAGRYVDELRREDGAWRIKRRTCVREWSISLPVTRDWLAGQDFVQSRRGPADLSWRVLGLTHSGNPWSGAVAAE